VRYTFSNLQLWQKYYNWHDGMTSSWSYNYKNTNRGYENWSGTQPDYWSNAETNAEFQNTGVYNDLGYGNGRGFMCRSWGKRRVAQIQPAHALQAVVSGTSAVNRTASTSCLEASRRLVSSAMPAPAAAPTATTWAFPDPGLGGCAVNTSTILTVNNRAAYRLVRQAMTYSNAREYCKTGTNAWNGTLVAWRDLETQLAVEQYFFVGGAPEWRTWCCASCRVQPGQRAGAGAVACSGKARPDPRWERA
jgi:hypothetical protein